MHHEVVDVELLYFADCPSWYLTRERLDQALRMSGHPEVEVRLRAVETDRQARDLSFPGSPTVRVNGRDAFPTTAGTYGLTCRVYTTPDGLTGSPTVDQLVHALRAASQSHASQ
ncbi:hypothetical protein SAMN04487905_1029 [Actinopolyspora xinjiangensis]|uniref:Thioredoxin domain-containing protein n=1 Tax=Actinopolyspora xinjiangensis TaxID=405564 RepID=A0A1H0Q1E3_9ACTN|nr:hypothetical protein SAMN04487905_1029 [Actinopolyspora xinjiangensis]